MSNNKNTEITANKGFAVMTNRNVLNEAMADNVYYRTKYTGGKNPPDCGSFDGVKGIGTPGGNCQNCPFNRFGSGEGQSKMCKNKRMLYILLEGELFPLTLSLPTGSLRSFTNYVKSQLSRARKLNQIVTKITLKKATNASGLEFSQAVFSFVRMLNADECAAVADVTETVKVNADECAAVADVTETVKEYAANLTTASLAEDEPMIDPETGEVIEPLK